MHLRDLEGGIVMRERSLVFASALALGVLDQASGEAAAPPGNGEARQIDSLNARLLQLEKALGAATETRQMPVRADASPG